MKILLFHKASSTKDRGTFLLFSFIARRWYCYDWVRNNMLISFPDFREKV